MKKNLLVIVAALSFNAALAQSDSTKFTTVGLISAGLPTSSFGKKNFKSVLSVDVNFLGRLSRSFKVGGDVGYSYFSADNATVSNQNLFQISFVARWYPAVFIGKIIKDDFPAKNIYLEGGIGHSFNGEILSKILLNYNHVKVGSHFGNFDLGLSSTAYGTSKSVAGNLSTANVYLGYRF